MLYIQTSSCVLLTIHFIYNHNTFAVRFQTLTKTKFCGIEPWPRSRLFATRVQTENQGSAKYFLNLFLKMIYSGDSNTGPVWYSNGQNLSWSVIQMPFKYRTSKIRHQMFVIQIPTGLQFLQNHCFVFHKLFISFYYEEKILTWIFPANLFQIPFRN